MSNEICLLEHKPVNELPKIEPTITCNGKVHRVNRYCKRPAGWGTEHAGVGRCKLHGGCTTGPLSGKLRYSNFIPTDLVQKYEELAVEDNIDIKSLNDEIALTRSMIANSSEHNKDGKNNKEICLMEELVRRLVETKQKVEEGVKSKITVEIVSRIVDDIIKIIDSRIQDNDLKRKIATDMRRLDVYGLEKLHSN